MTLKLFLGPTILSQQSKPAFTPPPPLSLPVDCGQNEWDDLMLETHTLKQHLNQTRQELSQSLYQVRKK